MSQSDSNDLDISCVSKSPELIFSPEGDEGIIVPKGVQVFYVEGSINSAKNDPYTLPIITKSSFQQPPSIGSQSENTDSTNTVLEYVPNTSKNCNLEKKNSLVAPKPNFIVGGLISPRDDVSTKAISGNISKGTSYQYDFNPKNTTQDSSLMSMVSVDSTHHPESSDRITSPSVLSISSVASSKKLEWDSAADVGCLGSSNLSKLVESGSSICTIERISVGNQEYTVRLDPDGSNNIRSPSKSVHQTKSSYSSKEKNISKYTGYERNVVKTKYKSFKSNIISSDDDINKTSQKESPRRKLRKRIPSNTDKNCRYSKYFLKKSTAPSPTKSNSLVNLHRERFIENKKGTSNKNLGPEINDHNQETKDTTHHSQSFIELNKSPMPSGSGISASTSGTLIADSSGELNFSSYRKDLSIQHGDKNRAGNSMSLNMGKKTQPKSKLEKQYIASFSESMQESSDSESSSCFHWDVKSTSTSCSSYNKQKKIKSLDKTMSSSKKSDLLSDSYSNKTEDNYQLGDSFYSIPTINEDLDLLSAKLKKYSKKLKNDASLVNEKVIEKLDEYINFIGVPSTIEDEVNVKQNVADIVIKMFAKIKLDKTNELSFEDFNEKESFNIQVTEDNFSENKTPKEVAVPNSKTMPACGVPILVPYRPPSASRTYMMMIHQAEEKDLKSGRVSSSKSSERSNPLDSNSCPLNVKDSDEKSDSENNNLPQRHVKNNNEDNDHSAANVTIISSPRNEVSQSSEFKDHRNDYFTSIPDTPSTQEDIVRNVDSDYMKPNDLIHNSLTVDSKSKPSIQLSEGSQSLSKEFTQHTSLDAETLTDMVEQISLPVHSSFGDQGIEERKYQQAQSDHSPNSSSPKLAKKQSTRPKQKTQKYTKNCKLNSRKYPSSDSTDSDVDGHYRRAMRAVADSRWRSKDDSDMRLGNFQKIDVWRQIYRDKHGTLHLAHQPPNYHSQLSESASDSELPRKKDPIQIPREMEDVIPVAERPPVWSSTASESAYETIRERHRNVDEALASSFEFYSTSPRDARLLGYISSDTSHQNDPGASVIELRKLSPAGAAAAACVTSTNEDPSNNLSSNSIHNQQIYDKSGSTTSDNTFRNKQKYSRNQSNKTGHYKNSKKNPNTSSEPPYKNHDKEGLREDRTTSCSSSVISSKDSSLRASKTSWQYQSNGRKKSSDQSHQSLVQQKRQKYIKRISRYILTLERLERTLNVAVSDTSEGSLRRHVTEGKSPTESDSKPSRHILGGSGTVSSSRVSSDSQHDQNIAQSKFYKTRDQITKYKSKKCKETSDEEYSNSIDWELPSPRLTSTLRTNVQIVPQSDSSDAGPSTFQKMEKEVELLKEIGQISDLRKLMASNKIQKTDESRPHRYMMRSVPREEPRGEENPPKISKSSQFRNYPSNYKNSSIQKNGTLQSNVSSRGDLTESHSKSESRSITSHSAGIVSQWKKSDEDSASRVDVTKSSVEPSEDEVSRQGDGRETDNNPFIPQLNQLPKQTKLYLPPKPATVILPSVGTSTKDKVDGNDVASASVQCSIIKNKVVLVKEFSQMFPSIDNMNDPEESIQQQISSGTQTGMSLLRNSKSSKVQVVTQTEPIDISSKLNIINEQNKYTSKESKMSENKSLASENSLPTNRSISQSFCSETQNEILSQNTSNLSNTTHNDNNNTSDSDQDNGNKNSNSFKVNASHYSYHSDKCSENSVKTSKTSKNTSKVTSSHYSSKSSEILNHQRPNTVIITDNKENIPKAGNTKPINFTVTSKATSLSKNNCPNDKSKKKIHIVEKPLSLREALEKARPSYIRCAESRRERIRTKQILRQEAQEHNHEVVAQIPPNLQTPKTLQHFLYKPEISPIFSYKALREQNKRIYRLLPEANTIASQKYKKSVHHTNRLMGSLYSQKLRQKVLTGKVSHAHRNVLTPK